MPAGHKRGDLDATARVSARELARRQREGRFQQGERQTSLVVYYRDGVRVVPIGDGATVVVGRSHPADVQIRDGSLSRQHACFESVDGAVWVEDLQSTNGTWVEGRRVDRQRLASGDEVMLGVVVATVQDLAPVEREAYGLASHDAFGRALEAEVSRAVDNGRELQLLMIRSERREGGRLSRWLPRLRELLRPYDRVAIYSGDTVEVLLPELGEQGASELARKAIEGPEQLLCGVARMTERLRSGDALLEAARLALQRATVRSPVQMWTAAAAGPDPSPSPAGEGPVVTSTAMKELFATAERVASAAMPVLVQGETGVGKEVVARALHEGSTRRGGPFVAINCGAIPPQLVEATLFGHERGAFTDAKGRAKGVFESAQGGTVLLDEVGELPPPAQAALLRVLETSRVTRVGSNEELAVDVRVLAATCRDLRVMSEAGEFRQDLLFRLEGVVLVVPPLRERIDDVAPLVERFVAAANAVNRCAVEGVTEEALDLLRSYPWPGNVRELRNAVERAVVIAHGSTVDIEDLPERIRELLRDGGSTAGSPVQPSGPPPSGDDEPANLKAEVQRYEAGRILAALEGADWNRKTAAHRLGLPLRTLSHKMQLYSLKRVDGGPSSG